MRPYKIFIALVLIVACHSSSKELYEGRLVEVNGAQGTFIKKELNTIGEVHWFIKMNDGRFGWLKPEKVKLLDITIPFILVEKDSLNLSPQKMENQLEKLELENLKAEKDLQEKKRKYNQAKENRNQAKENRDRLRNELINLKLFLGCKKSIFDHKHIILIFLLPYLDAPTKLQCLLLNGALYCLVQKALENDYDNLYHTVYEKINEKIKETNKLNLCPVVKNFAKDAYKIVSKSDTETTITVNFNRNDFAHPFSLKIYNTIFNFDPKKNAFNTNCSLKPSSRLSNPKFKTNFIKLCLRKESPVFIHFQKDEVATLRLVTVQKENQKSAIGTINFLFFVFVKMPALFCLVTGAIILGYKTNNSTLGFEVSFFIFIILLILDGVFNNLLDKYANNRLGK